MIRLIRSACVALILLLANAAQAAGLTIHVSPAGNDQWTGETEKANAPDGPLATLAGARDRIRTLRKQGKADGDITVQLHAGTYFLTETLQLLPEDGGTEKGAVSYVGNNDVVISGGVKITGWKVGPDGRWTTSLPEVKAGQWNFSQLYVNGQRRMRPRFPKQGYYHIAGRVPPPSDPKNPKPRADDRFRFAGDQIRAEWKNRSDVEVVTFHPWFTSMLRIAEVDPEQRLVTFTGSTRSTASFGQLTGGMRFLVENVAEALSEPGEWYLDRSTGILTYIPLPGETPEQSSVVAPRLEQLVVLNGSADGTGPAVKGLRFSGIAFMHTAWNTPATGSSISQAAVTVAAALSGNGACDIAVRNCRFQQLGGYAMEFGPGCKDIAIEGNRLVDLGGGGVKVGSVSQARTAESLASGVVVKENEIAHAGRVHSAAVGVWIGHAAHVTVASNSIYDLYYTGISSGWTWGYAKTRNESITLKDNHIHHIGQGALSDMAGIYTLGMSPNSRLSGNRIHDITRDKYGGWGIYYDEGSDGYTSENNLLYRCQDGGFHQHYGTNNVFRNNVIMDSSEVAWGPTRMDYPAKPGEVRPDKIFTFERNIIDGWRNTSVVRPEATGKLFEKHADKMSVDRNLYWNGRPTEPRFGRLSMADWQKWGLDVNSLVLDPKLPSPDAEPFAVPADTPATKVGFVPFTISPLPMSVPRADLDSARWPRWFPHANDGKARAIRDSFEFTPVGSTPDFSTPHEDGPATVRVTDEAFFAGKRSLKFTDARGIKNGYDPHMVYSPVNFKAGVAVARFAMRCDGGATFMHEWRGPGYPYASGPSIQLTSSGQLRAGGRVLTTINRGEWVQVEIRCQLGGQHGGIYEAIITPAGQQPLTFKDLPCAREFSHIHWLGFMAVGDKGVAYLDEFSLESQTGGK